MGRLDKQVTRNLVHKNNGGYDKANGGHAFTYLAWPRFWGPKASQWGGMIQIKTSSFTTLVKLCINYFGKLEKCMAFP